MFSMVISVISEVISVISGSRVTLPSPMNIGTIFYPISLTNRRQSENEACSAVYVKPTLNRVLLRTLLGGRIGEIDCTVPTTADNMTILNTSSTRTSCTIGNMVFEKRNPVRHS